MYGCNMRFRPPIQNSSRYFSRLKWVYRTQTLTSIEHHISSLHSHFWVQLSARSPFLPPTKTGNSCDLVITIIRKCGSDIYVRLQHAVPPTQHNSSRYFSRLNRVCRTQTLSSTEHNWRVSHSQVCSIENHDICVIVHTYVTFAL